jgi:hypothetical protein
MQHRIVWQIGNNISKESAASIFRIEDQITQHHIQEECSYSHTHKETEKVLSNNPKV